MKHKAGYVLLCALLLVLVLSVTGEAAVSLTGAVIEGGAGAPIQGVSMQLSNGMSTTTSASGVYAFSDVSGGAYTLYVTHDGHYARAISVTVTAGATTTQSISLVAVPASSAPTTDTFERADTAINGSVALGTTSGAETRTWTRLDANAYCGIAAGRLALTMPATSVNYDGVGLSTAFTAADFDASVDVVASGTGPSDSIQVLYRQTAYTQGGFYWNGFVLRSPSNGSYLALYLYQSGATTASFTNLVTTSIDWTRKHTLRIRAVGYRHTIWLDGQQMIDSYVYAWTNSGYFGFSQWGPASAAKITTYWDNFSIAKIASPAGSVTGKVYDASAPSLGVAGAVVKASSGQSATTDADGNYTLSGVPANLPVSLTATQDNYYFRTVTGVLALSDVPATQDIALRHLPTAGPADIVTDTFTRGDGTDLGVTEDDNHYAWAKGRDETLQSIANGELKLDTATYVNGVSVAGGFLPADLDMSVDVYTTTTGGGWPVGVGYRQPLAGSYGNLNGQDTNQSGYLVYIANDGLSVNLYRNSSPALQTVTASPALNMANGAKHTIRVKAVGSHHEAWVDGVKYIDYYGTQRLTGGHTALFRYKNLARFDNLSITRFPNPGLIAGTVTSVLDPATKIAGATVRLTVGGTVQSTTTDANGAYVFTSLAAGTYSVGVLADGYYSKQYTAIAVAELPVTRNFALVAASAQTSLVTDDFDNRYDENLGLTSGAPHLPYEISGENSSTLMLTGTGLLFMPLATHGVSLGGGFLPADLDVSVDLQISGTASDSGGISYREPEPCRYVYANGSGQGFAGYTVYASADGSRVALYRNGADLASAALTGIDWSLYHTLRVRAMGIRHEVFIDGVKYIDVLDGSKTGGGYVGITRNNVQMTVDNLSVAVFDPGAAATLSGTVSDRDTAAALSGATLRLSDGQIVTTDGSGVYTATVNAGIPYSVTAYRSGYAVATYSGIEPVPGTVFTQNVRLTRQADNKAVFDTFTRANSTSLGTTEDAQHYAWGKATGETTAAISINQLKLGAGIAGWGVGINTTAFQPADVDISADILASTLSDAQWVGICYRQAAIGDMNSGYHVYFWGAGKDNCAIVNWGNGGFSKSGMPLPNSPVNWSVPHRVRVKAVGPHHQVWFDGVLVNELYDWAKLTGGYINFNRWNCEAYYDNVAIFGNSALDSTSLTSAADAKRQADGTIVSLSGCYVTGVFGGFFYVEDLDRTAGIKILSSKTVSIGDIVAIDGMVSTADGEKLIAAREVSATPSETRIKPLGMTTKANNLPSSGLPSTGLLTRVWGTVKSVAADLTYFVIDDGSGVQVKVMCPGTTKPVVNDYVACTGIARMISAAAPALQMRDNDDLWIRGVGP